MQDATHSTISFGNSIIYHKINSGFSSSDPRLPKGRHPLAGGGTSPTLIPNVYIHIKHIIKYRKKVGIVRCDTYLNLLIYNIISN